MRIAVASCWNYRDAWLPMFALLDKFWPSHPWTTLIVDHSDWRVEGVPVGYVGFVGEVSWCQVVSRFSQMESEPILLLQEDFFLNAPVNVELVEHGLKILERENVGAVRIYPCPGATEASGDPYFGMIEPHTPYRNSLQATIYEPKYLHAIASRFNTPSEFELLGSSWASANLSDEVWAFKREVQPWPMEYYCSAISRGKWEPAALEFCRQQGIEVDTSMRGIAWQG